MKPITWILGLLLLVAVGAGAFVWSGAYNIAADDPHWAVTERVLETVRERSIEARIPGIVVPELGDEARVRKGAGNYDEMCADCHRHPGEDHSELGGGMYPAPPDLSEHRIDDAAEAFWVIKHGIKMTGMPAWGKHMDDESIFDVVAFLRQLPELSESRYDELVESSEGHSHGRGDDREAGVERETDHVHADGTEHEHDD